jgi:signal transduction histidine kinase
VLAAVSVAVAMVFTRLLRGIGDFGISPLFFAAVLLTAWYGGFGPGLFATFLSGVAAASLLLKEHGAGFSHIGEHLLRVGTFSVVSILASSLHVAMKSAAEASRRAKEAAETASEAKSRFLAMVSHELRTPLSPVLMLAEILEHDPALPPRLVKDIRAIRKNVDLEIRLIEDLVDLTRISVGKMRLKEQLIDICGPLNAALDVCRDDIRDVSTSLAILFDFSRSFGISFAMPSSSRRKVAVFRCGRTTARKKRSRLRFRTPASESIRRDYPASSKRSSRESRIFRSGSADWD